MRVPFTLCLGNAHGRNNLLSFLALRIGENQLLFMPTQGGGTEIIMAENTKTKKAPAKKKSPPKNGAKKQGTKNTTKQMTKMPKGSIKNKTLSNEIKGILLIALGIFLACSFLSDMTGALGNAIKNICYGLLGVSVSVSCVFIVVTGIKVFLDKIGDKNIFRIVMLLLIMIMTSVITSMGMGNYEFTGDTFFDNILILWNDGINCNGGGVIGGGLCGLLHLCIGSAGTWVFAIAAELVFIILLTEISIEKVFKSIAGIFANGEKEYEDADGEGEFELPEYTEQSERVKEKLRKRREAEGQIEKNEPKKKKGFFDKYFGGEEPIDDEPTDIEEKKYRRFKFEEDDEILDGIISEGTDIKNAEDLPFDIDNMKTGVISELPDENGNYEKPVENEEGTDYEPPSQAKLEDVLDNMTQKAVDKGVPLDRAVLAGKRMAVEEAEEQTIEAKLEKQIKEEAQKPKIVRYRLPKVDLLEKPKPMQKSRSEIRNELEEKANRLLDTLRSFKVDAKIINITQGPSVTRFELQPGLGVKVSKITNLADDIALSLAASGVRIEPVAGKSAIGIEIPNKTATPVSIREVIESDNFKKFKSKTAFALGKDISGSCVVADFADFPHALIAGGTGSGKSVCINSLIMSILFKARPDEIKMIMVDPKMVELSVYDGLPHLLIPVVTDPKHAAGALNWAVGEMKNRYKLLNENKVRNLKDHNKLMEEIDEPDAKLPEIVIIIDELADLMLAAKNEVESAINSIAALARAAGMYLVIATQRPSVDVVTGVIKNNIPTRIALSVSSSVDSRTILDCGGAEKLLGKGDMLYSPRGAAKPIRIQGNFVCDKERDAVIDYIKGQYKADYDEEIIENIQKEVDQVNSGAKAQQSDDADDGGDGSKDKMFYEAVELVLENGQASVAMFQRKFKMGYQRAAKLIDQMEKYNIIGPYEGTKPRQVLITRQEYNEMRINNPEE